jgi:hypothetical protein
MVSLMKRRRCQCSGMSDQQPLAVLRLEWSWDRPAEWDPIMAWWERLRRHLESCLAGEEKQA